MANKRVKVTITGMYELIPDFYPPNATPEQMMKIDQGNDNLDSIGLLESLGDDIVVKFELVEE